MLSTTIGASVNRFLNILGNRVEKVPCLAFPTCDVRDVAEAHMYLYLLLKINQSKKLFKSLKLIEMLPSYQKLLVIDTF